MEEGKLARVSEVLFINMYGEGRRDNNAIYITDFKRNNVESKVCFRIALSVASLYKYKVFIECGIVDYFRVLIENKMLFKNRKVYRNRVGYGRSAEAWTRDISNALGEDKSIWDDVWEYLNGK